MKGYRVAHKTRHLPRKSTGTILVRVDHPTHERTLQSQRFGINRQIACTATPAPLARAPMPYRVLPLLRQRGGLLLRREVLFEKSLREPVFAVLLEGVDDGQFFAEEGVLHVHF